MEEHPPVILLNKDALDINDLFLNDKWTLVEIYDRIFSINVKENKLNWIVKTYDKKKLAQRESKNLHKLKNIPKIPTIIAQSISNHLNYIIISESPGIDMFDYVDKYGHFSEQETKHIAKQLLSILKQIHKKNVIHHDIKPENIIYDKHTQNITLIDFEQRRTEGYSSPEQVKHSKKITYKTDIWSAGITIYFLASGERLFETDQETLENHIVLKKEWSSDFKDFLLCLIEKDIDIRYSSKEALNHIWLFD